MTSNRDKTLAFGRSQRTGLVPMVGSAAIALSILVIPGDEVFAQAPPAKGQLQPPTPVSGQGQSGDGAGFMSYAVAILLVAAMLGVSFIPSKRGHQD